jgi:hypothetical protein
MSRALALVMAGGLSGCNLVFGLELPADDDDGVVPDGREARFAELTRLEISTPVALYAGDMDRDGDADVVVASPDGNAAVVVRCDASRTCGATFFATVAPPTAITALDANRDGLTDVAMIAGNGGAIVVHHNAGDGDLTPGPSIPEAAATSLFGGPIVAGDVTHDIAVAHKGRADVAVYGNNAGSFVPVEGVAAPTMIYDVSTGDISGDGRLDLVISDETGVRLYQSTTALGGFVEFGNAFDGGNNDLLVARIDGGDDLLDLVLGRPGALQVWLGDGGGAFHAAPIRDVPIPVDAGGVRLAVGDADGDGRGGDVAALALASGIVHVFHTAADGTLTAGPEVIAGAEPSAIALADLDGDGQDDLVVARALVGELKIWFAR